MCPRVRLGVHARVFGCAGVGCAPGVPPGSPGFPRVRPGVVCSQHQRARGSRVLLLLVCAPCPPVEVPSGVPGAPGAPGAPGVPWVPCVGSGVVGSLSRVPSVGCGVVPPLGRGVWLVLSLSLSLLVLYCPPISVLCVGVPPLSPYWCWLCPLFRLLLLTRVP